MHFQRFIVWFEIFSNLILKLKNGIWLGWGKTSEGIFGKRSPILHQVQLPVISNHICKEKYKLINEYKAEIQFGNSVLCAGYAGGGKDRLVIHATVFWSSVSIAVFTID